MPDPKLPTMNDLRKKMEDNVQVLGEQMIFEMKMDPRRNTNRFIGLYLDPEKKEVHFIGSSFDQLEMVEKLAEIAGNLPQRVFHLMGGGWDMHEWFAVYDFPEEAHRFIKDNFALMSTAHFYMDWKGRYYP